MNAEERSRTIEEYGRGYEVLKQTLADIPSAAWKFRPVPGEWSVHEVILHMADSEMMGLTRLHKLIAEPGSTLMPYDSTRWGEALDYAAQSMEEALELFRLLRRRGYLMLKRLPEPVFSNSAPHVEYPAGYTLDDWLQIYADHVREHVEQMQAAHRAWKAKQP